MLRHERQPVREFPFVHAEAADGSSRRLGVLAASPTADIEFGTVMVVRANDNALVVPQSASVDAAHDAPCIVLARVGALPPSARDPRRYPLNLMILARDAEVIGSRLTWPAGITANQRAALVAQLGAVGIVVL